MKEVGIDITALPPAPARVAAAVQRKIDSGDMYDAQQLVKTFSNRYNDTSFRFAFFAHAWNASRLYHGASS